jgi:hypothetical protein
VLDEIGKVVKDLGPTFGEFGTFLGGLFDRHVLEIGPLMEGGIKLAVRAIEGFLGVLEQLSNWFQARLPTYGPIVAQVFGFLGSVIVGIATVWGQFADWLVKEWPTIVHIAEVAVKDLKDQWDKWWPTLQPLIQAALPMLGMLLIVIAQHGGALVPVIMLLVAVLLYVTIGVMAIVAALQIAIEWVTALGWAFDAWKLKVVTDVREVISYMNMIPGVNVPMPELPGQGGSAPPSGRRGGPIAAAGGFEGTVFGPTLFMAGEGGAPEHVSIGSRGGSGTTIHFHISGLYADGPGIDRLVNAVVQRMGYVTGR